MPTGFDEAFRRVKEPVAVFGDYESFYFSSKFQALETRHDCNHECWVAQGCDQGHKTRKRPHGQKTTLAVRKQLAAAQSDKYKDFYTHRCDGLDCQIDTLVHDLHALPPDEIKIVEGEAK